MKSIAFLYLDYLEKVVISMVLASLVLTSISGFAYGDKGWIPAILSVITLVLIIYVAIGQRGERDSAKFKKKPFGAIRFFSLLLQQKAAALTEMVHFDSRKPTIQRAMSRGLAIVILALAAVAIWSSFSISADIAFKKSQDLKNNQAIAGARPGIPATFFNKAVVIDVLKVSDGSSPTVTAIIRSEVYPDQLKIEGAGVGYETTFIGPNQYRIRILRIDNSTVQFFVERLQGALVPR